LKLAGYPFRANDLTPEEWNDLGRAEEIMQQKEFARSNAKLASILAAILRSR